MTPPPKIWVTRPQPDAVESAAKLTALGFDPIIAPLLDMRVLPPNLPAASGFAAIALTSTNAIRALQELETLTNYMQLPAYCVGARTAHAAKQAGFTQVFSADGALQDLAQLIAQQHSKGPVFYPSAQHVQGDLAAALAPADRLVISANVYEMQPVTHLPPQIAAEIAAGNISAVSLYSRRTAETYCTLTSGIAQSHAITALCLSENVAQPLLEHHFARIGLADYPSEEAMMALALAFLRSHTETQRQT